MCERAVDSGEKDRGRGEEADGGGGEKKRDIQRREAFLFFVHTNARTRALTKIETKKQFHRKTGNKSQTVSLTRSQCV